VTVNLRGLGVCSTYPDSITFGQSIQCAFDPWSDTCKKLKEQADLECAQYTGAISQPPMPPAPPVPTEGTQPGLTTRSAQEIQDEIIAKQTAEYQARVKAFMDAQAAAADAAAKVSQQQCGMFTSWNQVAGDCLFDPTRPAFLILALGGLAALFAFGRRR
jgi:hypothetical protein